MTSEDFLKLALRRLFEWESSGDWLVPTSSAVELA